MWSSIQGGIADVVKVYRVVELADSLLSAAQSLCVLQLVGVTRYRVSWRVKQYRVVHLVWKKYTGGIADVVKVFGWYS